MATTQRIARLIATQGIPIAVVLGIVGVAALGGAWTAYANPTTEQVTDHVNQQTIETAVDTRAVVVGNSTLYERGEVLRNKPVYFQRATPRLTLLVNTSLPAGPRVSVTHRIDLQLVASRDGRQFWEETRTLADATERTTDGLVTTRTVLNMSDIRAQIGERRAEISGVGTLRTLVRVHVEYETDRYDGTLTGSTPIVFADRAYWLAESIGVERTHSETVTRTVRSAPDTVASLGLGALGVVALLGAIGVLLFRREVDVRAIETAVYRTRYDEWISRGEFPTGTNKKYVRINSLEDLVDIAIDSNKRVVFDEDYDVYAIVDSDIVYYFTTDPVQVDAWLDV